MSTGDTIAVIREKLQQTLSPLRLEILDESWKHAGHEGARAGGGHYAVTIVSEAFAGLGLAERHRLVYRALAGEMKRTIHALALRTLDPSEWRASDDAAGPAGGSGPGTRRDGM